MVSMLVRREGSWVEEQDLSRFASQEFTESFVRKLLYTIDTKNRGEREEVICRYVVEDPVNYWGVSRDFVRRILDEAETGEIKQNTDTEEMTLW